MIWTGEDNLAVTPATHVLSYWKTQHRGWCRKSKSELSHIMAELGAFNKFKFLEVLRVQATYPDTTKFQ